MKVTFAFQMVLMPCMLVDAAMYKETDYTTSTCDAGSEKESKWEPQGICSSVGDNVNYMKAACVNGAMTVTVYSDSGCSTVNTTWTNPDTSSTAVVNNGVITLPTGCENKGSGEGRMIDCSAAQPAYLSLSVYTDATCTTSDQSKPTMMVPIDECKYDMDGMDGQGGSDSGSGGSGGSGSPSNATGNTRRLGQHTTSGGGIVAEKTAWSSSNNQATTTYYSDKSCGTAVTSPSPTVMDFGADGTTCKQMGSKYYKLGQYNPPGTGTGTASGCDRMQSLFLLPLLVFLGVAKMIML